jgi:hypothetical protein
MNADTPLTQYYKTTDTWSSTPVTVSGSTVTLSWNAVEGGIYQVSASTDITSTPWPNLPGTVTSTGNLASKTDTVDTTNTKKFYKLTRTGITPYDSVGY